LRSASDISSDFGTNIDSEKEKPDVILPKSSANKAEAMACYAIAIMDASKKAGKEVVTEKLLEVIKNDPYGETPLFLLLNSFKKKKPDEKVLEKLTLYARENPDALKLNVTVSASLIDKKDFKTALELLEKTYNSTKDKVSGISSINKVFYANMVDMLANIYSDRSEFKKGDELFDDLIEEEKFKENFAIRSSAAEFYRKASDGSDNSAWLWFLEGDKDKYKRKMNESLKAIELLCEKSYNDPYKLLPIIEIYKKSGNPEKAKMLLYENLLARPNDIKTMTVLAILYYDLGEFNNSFRMWKAISRKSSSTNQSCFMELARSAMRFEDYKEAAKALEWFLISHPHDRGAIYLLAVCYFEKEMYRKCIKKLSKMRPSFESNYLSAIAYKNLRKFKKAEKKLLEAEKLAEKTKKEDLNDNFYMTMAYIAEKAGNVKKSEEALKILLKKNPDDHEAQNFLGYIWADHNQNLDEAEKLIVAALKKKPDNSAYLDSMAWVLYRKGKYKEALEYIKKSLKGAGEVPDAVIADHAGDIYYALKDNEKALKYWKLASEIHSEDLDRDKVFSKLKELEEKMKK
jgi:tetratricopeptide (TPR) repeat protein